MFRAANDNEPSQGSSFEDPNPREALGRISELLGHPVIKDGVMTLAERVFLSETFQSIEKWWNGLHPQYQSNILSAGAIIPFTPMRALRNLVNAGMLTYKGDADTAAALKRSAENAKMEKMAVKIAGYIPALAEIQPLTNQIEKLIDSEAIFNAEIRNHINALRVARLTHDKVEGVEGEADSHSEAA